MFFTSDPQFKHQGASYLLEAFRKVLPLTVADLDYFDDAPFVTHYCQDLGIVHLNCSMRVLNRF